MSRSSFRVEHVDDHLDGFEGIFLAGPILEDEANFAVGDILMIPTLGGLVEGRCTGFPLVRWGQERRNWISLTVSGVRAEDLYVGEVVNFTPTEV